MNRNTNIKQYPITLILLLLFFLLMAQATARGQSSSSTASRVRSGTSDPATCTTTGSNIFYRTDTGALKVCTATNTWTALSTSTGTVTSVSVTTANGVSGSVANATTTPAITLTLGAIVPTSVNSVVISGASTPTLAVTGTSTISGTNTGDQTSVSGNAGTATALQTARTIGGVSFDGTANITVATATGGFTVSGGDLALGANSLTLTGSIAATGARVTKGWFTDVESTNMYTVGGTSLNSTFAPIASPTFTGTVTIPTPFTVGATSVTSTGTQLNYLNAATGTTGTTSTNIVFSTSPTLVTPTLGVATATRIGIGVAADATASISTLGSILGNITQINAGSGIEVNGTGASIMQRTVTSSFDAMNSALQVRLRASGGSAAVNGGVSVLYYYEDASANVELMGRTGYRWENATHNSEASSFVVTTRSTANTAANVERLVVNSIGITSLFKGADVASDAAIVPTGNLFHVTGTNNITSITSTGITAGTVITIIFDGVLTFTDGSNLVLAGNFVTSANDSITLAYDGTNWIEIARSVN